MKWFLLTILTFCEERDNAKDGKLVPLATTIYTLGCFLYFKKINFLPSASSFLFLLTIHTSPGRKRSSQNDNCDWGGTNMYYSPQEFTLPFLKMVKCNEFAFIIWNLYSNSQSNCYGIRYFMFWPKKKIEWLLIRYL